MKHILFAVLFACSNHGSRVDLGTTPHPIGLVKDVRFGMTVEELKKAAPQLTLDSAGEFSAYGRVDRGAVENYAYTVALRDGRVSAIAVHLYDRHGEELKKAWGVGIATGGDETRYLNSTEHVRVDVGPGSVKLHFTPYETLDSLLEEPNFNAIAHVEVLGRPIAEVVADFKKAGRIVVDVPDAHTTLVELANTEYSAYFDVPKIALHPDQAGNVTRWQMLGAVNKPTAENTTRVMDVYAKRFGVPREMHESGLGDISLFHERPWIYSDGSELTGQSYDLK